MKQACSYLILNTTYIYSGLSRGKKKYAGFGWLPLKNYYYPPAYVYGSQENSKVVNSMRH